MTERALTLRVVIASTAILVATNSAFTTEHKRTVAERFWQSLLRMIDPGTMVTDRSWGRRLLSLMRPSLDHLNVQVTRLPEPELATGTTGSGWWSANV